METENLKTFILLADLKNFTHTAEQLFVAQSTVTNRIAELESEIGRKLFKRDNKNVSLTEEGLLFLNYAKRIVELEESSIQEINSIRSYNKKLKIGTTNLIYDCFLSSNLRDFVRNNNDISVKVTIGNSIEMLQMLKDDVLDVVYSFIPSTKQGLICNKFGSDKLVLVTSCSNNTFQGGIKKEDLLSIKYLLCNFIQHEDGISISELFPKFFQFSFEINNSSKIINYLLDGIGYSFLPESLVKPYIEKGALVKINTLDFETPHMSYYCSYKNKIDIMAEFPGIVASQNMGI